VLAAGQQAFYSSLFALISDVAGRGPRERPFAIAGMVRSAAFGLGGLAAAAALTAAGPGALRAAVAADAGSFVACALLLALFVRLARHHPAGQPDRGRVARRVLANRPFLVLMAGTGLTALATDVFLTGTPVYALDILHARPWLPGTLLAVETLLTSVAGTAVLRATRRLHRLAAMRLAAALCGLWCAVSLAAVTVPPAWRTAVLLLAQVALAAAGLVAGPRQLALAEAVAPPQARGRYLAAFQYAFAGAQVAGPAVVALYSVADWLPWAVTAGCAGLAFVGFRALTNRLPAAVLMPVPGG
jgi:hypothetical protein